MSVLLKEKLTFLTQLKKLILSLKKTKKILKAVSVMKEDRQAFGEMLGGERSEPRGGVLVPCYIGATKISISTFDF